VTTLIPPPAGETALSDQEQALAGQLREAIAMRLVAADSDAPGGTLPPRERQELGARLLAERLQAHNTARLRRGEPALDPAAEQRIARAVRDALFGLGGLQELLDDPRIENIDVNGHDQVFLRYADGRREQHPKPVAASDEALVALVRQLAAHAGAEERRFDRAVPRLNVQLPDGSRMFAVMAVSGRPSLSIRRHRFRAVTLTQLGELGMFDPEVEDFLRRAVLARKNILVSGGTNAGKTTLLRGLASVIPVWERLVTIEDTIELGLHETGTHPNVVWLQAREANIEGQGAIDQAELVRWGLRMAPDRVIVGEIRGAEVIPMCNAMSQGNDGSMSTIHASTSRGAFTKLAAYAAQSPERLPVEATNLLVASAVHFVVQLARDTHGVRCVSSIREIVDADGPQIVSNEVFRPGPDHRAVRAAALRTDTQRDLDRAAP
jgi:pilus assembly protein CpaF